MVLLAKGSGCGSIATCPATAVRGDEDDPPGPISVSMASTATMAEKLNVLLVQLMPKTNVDNNGLGGPRPTVVEVMSEPELESSSRSLIETRPDADPLKANPPGPNDVNRNVACACRLMLKLKPGADGANV